MEYYMKYIIKVTEKEADVIRNVFESIRDCPFPIDDKEVVDLIEEIANHSDGSNTDMIQILYDEGEEA